MGLGTTATMVYGHIETIEERVDHLIKIRDLQSERPKESPGFRAFICWPMQTEGTKLVERYETSEISIVEHLKMVAISRIFAMRCTDASCCVLAVACKTIKDVCIDGGVTVSVRYVV